MINIILCASFWERLNVTPNNKTFIENTLFFHELKLDLEWKTVVLMYYRRMGVYSWTTHLGFFFEVSWVQSFLWKQSSLKLKFICPWNTQHGIYSFFYITSVLQCLNLSETYRLYLILWACWQGTKKTPFFSSQFLKFTSYGEKIGV